MTTRYFHGTLADLRAGDLLVPGAVIGKRHHAQWLSEHVYGTTSDVNAWREHLEDANLDDDASPDYAISAALYWACVAADATCAGIDCAGQDDDPDCRNPHVDAHQYGSAPTCVRVYEIEPVGDVNVDGPGTKDGEGPAVKMASARVLRRIQ